MKKAYLVLSMLASSLLATSIFAQEAPDTIPGTVEKIQSDLGLLKNLKVSGYFQFQSQFADSASIQSYAGGNFLPGVDKRFGVRRGRLKFAYSSNSWSQYVVQFDITESGFKTKDVYAKFTEPFLKSLTLTGGVFNRPWGYEIEYSSSLRESPERTRFNQTLFKDERDLGVMLTLQAPKTSRLNFVKLDVGLFSGTAINTDFDNYKDVIARLNVSKAFLGETLKVSGDLSYYNGGYANQSPKSYKYDEIAGIKDMYSIVVDSLSRAKRELYGADLQITFESPIGLTTLRGEFSTGQQAASANDATSPLTLPTYSEKVTNTANLTTGAVTSSSVKSYPASYLRKTTGYYVYFVHSIGRHSIVAKYDLYDPNTQIAGTDIVSSIGKDAGGKDIASKFTKADVKYTTLGIGYAFRLDANTKISFYRDMVTNEKTLLKGYMNDLKDNVWTIRLQYKF